MIRYLPLLLLVSTAHAEPQTSARMEATVVSSASITVESPQEGCMCWSADVYVMPDVTAVVTVGLE